MQRLSEQRPQGDPVASDVSRLLRLAAPPAPPPTPAWTVPVASGRSGALLRWAVVGVVLVLTTAVASAWVVRTVEQRKEAERHALERAKAPVSRRKAPLPELPPTATVTPPQPPPAVPLPIAKREAVALPLPLPQPAIAPAAAATTPFAPSLDDPGLAPSAPSPTRAVPVDETDAPPTAAIATPQSPAPALAAPSAPEAALVLEATRTLHRDGDAARALHLLDRYLATYPRGALVEESLALTVEAKAQLGDSSAADAAADYLKRFPRGRFRALAENARERFAPQIKD